MRFLNFSVPRLYTDRETGMRTLRHQHATMSSRSKQTKPELGASWLYWTDHCIFCVVGMQNVKCK